MRLTIITAIVGVLRNALVGLGKETGGQKRDKNPSPLKRSYLYFHRWPLLLVIEEITFWVRREKSNLTKNEKRKY